MRHDPCTLAAAGDAPIKGCRQPGAANEQRQDPKRKTIHSKYMGTQRDYPRSPQQHATHSPDGPMAGWTGGPTNEAKNVDCRGSILLAGDNRLAADNRLAGDNRRNPSFTRGWSWALGANDVDEASGLICRSVAGRLTMPELHYGASFHLLFWTVRPDARGESEWTIDALQRWIRNFWERSRNPLLIGSGVWGAVQTSLFSLSEPGGVCAAGRASGTLTTSAPSVTASTGISSGMRRSLQRLWQPLQPFKTEHRRH